MKSSLRYKTSYFTAAVLTLFGLIFFSRAVLAADFVDSKNNWNRREISQLQAMDILRGYPDGRFYPEQAVSRAEFAKMLTIALGDQDAAQELSPAASIFADTPFDFWGKGYIMAGVERGWLQGWGDYFAPEADITRQEAAVIISRILSAEEVPGEDEEALDFTDSDIIADWALGGVQKAAAQQFITGFPDGSFRPLEQLSRAEAVHLLAVIMNHKGMLFDGNGLLKKADGNGLTIQLSGKDRLFKTTAQTQIFDRNNLITDELELFPARINFNLNRSGEIVHAQISYSHEYLELSVKQMENPAVQEELVLGSSDTAPLPLSGHILGIEGQDSATVLPLNIEQAELSLLAAREAAGIERLQSEMGVSGRGVTIAIIDSGIDPLHQDLQRTPDGQRKILDWVNFCEEGRVNTNLLAYAAAGDNFINTERGQYTLPGIEKSQSGQYHYGFWSEEWISYLYKYDFTGNNSNDDQILVLVVDAKTAGVYDTVFVDTNQNFSLADEVPLKIFRDNKFNYASFPKTTDLPRGFPFVLCDIWEGGKVISFGYDSEGHGTHVAGIAAAYGLLQGAAPGAQLIALKVADGAGIAYLDNTLKAVEYAVRKGADIINLSLGYYERDEEAIERFRQRINELAAHTLICEAAGNDGPGLATLAAPADAPNTLAVGAYIAPEMLAVNYGWTAEAAVPWYFSSAGPARDGSLKPDLLAPGSVISTVPVWKSQSVQLIEGSSMAAPFAAGSAALLMEDLWKEGHGFNSLMLKQALINAAQPLDYLSPAEQGYGVLDAYAAAQFARQIEGLPDDSGVKISSVLSGDSAGLIARQYLPGRTTFTLSNNSREARIKWQSSSEWLQLENNPEYLPASGQRDLQVSYALPARAGLYTGMLEGTFVDSSRIPVKSFQTIIIPETWSKNGEVDLYADLPGGQMQRIYLQVPAGQKSLQLKLRILGSGNKLQGRARMHIYDAAGQLYNVTEFAGQAPSGLTAQREISEVIASPQAGVWEIVIYSSSTLSNYALTNSNFVFNARLAQPVTAPVLAESDFIIVAACPRSNDSRADIRLTILNASDNLPYSGLLQINERLYSVKQGKVLVTAGIERGTANLIVKRVEQ